MQQPTPDQYSPPLRWWEVAWRYAAVAAISAVAWGPIASIQWHHHRWTFWVDAAVGLVTLVASWYRRRWPFAVGLFTACCQFASASATGPGVLVLTSLSTRRVVWQSTLVGLVSIVLSQGFADTQPATHSQHWWQTLLFSVPVTFAVIVYGMYVGSRRELLWSLRERARQAEAGQELRVQSARVAERQRIAREMHDVLAHRISMVALQSGALTYRQDLTSEQIRETAGLIQGSAHAALSELRAVLGVLREEDGAPLEGPQPTLRDLESLTEQARAAGMRVDEHISVSGIPSDVIARTAYRIVQEGLTNARKHSYGARVGVRVTGAPDHGLDVEVTNPRRPGGESGTPGAGLGLVGLRERAELVGGTLEFVPSPDGFVLNAHLPWQEETT